MGNNQPIRDFGTSEWFSLCQTDQATLRCGVQHMLQRPDDEIVAYFEPFVSLDDFDLRDLMSRLNAGTTPVVESEKRRPSLTIASRLVSSKSRLATVKLPEAYVDRRLVRVDVCDGSYLEVCTEACERVITTLREDDDCGMLPTVSELDVVSVDVSIEMAGSRFSMLWKNDGQGRIEEPCICNNVVEVIATDASQDTGWLKVVSLVKPDQSLGRYVVRGQSDQNAVETAIAVASRHFARESYDWSANVTFVDPVVQTDGKVYVAHV